MKIKRIEVLNLNAALSEITIANISKETIKSIVKTKIELSKHAAEFEDYRQKCVRECSDNSVATELLEEFLLKEIEIDLCKIDAEQIENLIEANELKLSVIEHLYKFLT